MQDQKIQKKMKFNLLKTNLLKYQRIKTTISKMTEHAHFVKSLINVSLKKTISTCIIFTLVLC